MKLESSVIKEGQPIPPRYTCQGDNISPPLVFVDAPEDTRSFALIMDDPDAPGGTFDHWVVWNIAGETRELLEAHMLVDQGKNSYGVMRYNGPCPPPGNVHRYFFKLYALDGMLELPRGTTKKDLESAIEGHILAKAELVGIFSR